jgi:hypothetical protein
MRIAPDPVGYHGPSITIPRDFDRADAFRFKIHWGDDERSSIRRDDLLNTSSGG